MTILTNIKDEMIILKTLTESKGVVAEQDVGMIDVDYSLIRYLANYFALKEVTLNNWGYPVIKQDNEITTLYRVILEYYSKYDEKLKEMLKNKKYEINHKNRDKLDNRIQNLEVVTHQNNIRHCKGLDYEAIISSQQLQEIQQKNLKDKQQKTDKEYLSRISGLFYKSMRNNQIDEKIFKSSYLKLGYISSSISMSSFGAISGNVLDKLVIPKFLPLFPTNSIQLLLLQHKQFVYKTIISRNIALLNKYIEKYPYIKEVLIKYKLMDKSNLTDEHKNILLEFYKQAYNTNKYTINSGNILLVVSIKDNFKTVGRYKAFIMLYILGILQRQKYITRVKIPNHHIPSFIWIVALKDEDFKQINLKAKELLDLNWNSVRYFMVAETFGEDVANLVYSNNKRCKKNYKYAQRAKEDIINYLKMNKTVKIEGFITKDKIFDYVRSLNAYRKQYGVNYSKIKKGFYNFISSLLLYNDELKVVLEQQGLIYTGMNTKIIRNIEQYQKQNGISNPIHNLKPNMRVVVLKELIN